MVTLVTGGAGFIGSHVCESLLKKKQKVICVDNFNNFYSPARKRDNLQRCNADANFILEEHDILDYACMEAIFKRYRPDSVVHLAARAGVRPSVQDPFLYEETNIRGTLNMLDLSKKFKVRKFIFGSSSSVYGKNQKIPFSESDITDCPVSPYAATKKAGELLCYNYSYLYGLKIICLRFFTVYGPRGRPDMAPYLFSEKIMKGQEITVYGDGSSRRDYTYVADIVSGILASIEYDCQFEIFNLGESRTVELRELISTIENLAGKKAIINRKEPDKADVPVTFADISKAKKYLNYNPTVDINKGMASFFEWFKSI